MDVVDKTQWYSSDDENGVDCSDAEIKLVIVDSRSGLKVAQIYLTNKTRFYDLKCTVCDLNIQHRCNFNLIINSVLNHFEKVHKDLYKNQRKLLINRYKSNERSVYSSMAYLTQLLDKEERTMPADVNEKQLSILFNKIVRSKLASCGIRYRPGEIQTVCEQLKLYQDLYSSSEGHITVDNTDLDQSGSEGLGLIADTQKGNLMEMFECEDFAMLRKNLLRLPCNINVTVNLLLDLCPSVSVAQGLSDEILRMSIAILRKKIEKRNASDRICCSDNLDIEELGEKLAMYIKGLPSNPLLSASAGTSQGRYYEKEFMMAIPITQPDHQIAALFKKEKDQLQSNLLLYDSNFILNSDKTASDSILSAVARMLLDSDIFENLQSAILSISSGCVPKSCEFVDQTNNMCGLFATYWLYTRIAGRPMSRSYVYIATFWCKKFVKYIKNAYNESLRRRNR